MKRSGLGDAGVATSRRSPVDPIQEVTDDTLSIDIEDGRSVSVSIGWYPRLANGTPAERANLQISGAGYGLHWPDLDEDIGVEGLLLGKHSPESPSSFERWLQRRREKLPQDAP